jgi:hypothetical protein
MHVKISTKKINKGTKFHLIFEHLYITFKYFSKGDRFRREEKSPELCPASRRHREASWYSRVLPWLDMADFGP